MVAVLVLSLMAVFVLSYVWFFRSENFISADQAQEKVKEVKAQQTKAQIARVFAFIKLESERGNTSHAFRAEDFPFSKQVHELLEKKGYTVKFCPGCGDGNYVVSWDKIGG